MKKTQAYQVKSVFLSTTEWGIAVSVTWCAWWVGLFLLFPFKPLVKDDDTALEMLDELLCETIVDVEVPDVVKLDVLLLNDLAIFFYLLLSGINNIILYPSLSQQKV